MQISLNELAQAKDLELGASPWLTVTQERINTFADATDDHQWIHVDPERAATGPFGATIAHGYLTLSLVPVLLSGLLTVTEKGRGINYGLEKVRFLTPVKVGSRVRLVASIPSASRRDDGGVQYRIAITIQIEGQERPAMIGESIYLMYPE